MIINKNLFSFEFLIESSWQTCKNDIYRTFLVDLRLNHSEALWDGNRWEMCFCFFMMVKM